MGSEIRFRGVLRQLDSDVVLVSQADRDPVTSFPGCRQAGDRCCADVAFVVRWLQVPGPVRAMPVVVRHILVQDLWVPETVSLHVSWSYSRMRQRTCPPEHAHASCLLSTATSERGFGRDFRGREDHPQVHEGHKADEP